MSEKTTVILDASAFKDSACLLRLFRTTVEGYRGKINYNDMEFGSAFHLFRKIYREKGMLGMAEGMRAAAKYYTETPMLIKHNKKYLDLLYLQKTCLAYATTYEHDTFKPVISDGEPLLELTFSFPYYVDEEVEILLAGTMDEIGKFDNGIYAVCDAKTTSVWAIDDYFRSYLLSPQLMFYRWVLRRYAEHYPDSIFGEINKLDVACMIDGIFYKGGNSETTFKRSEVFLFSDNQLANFSTLVERKVHELINAIKEWRATGKEPLREGMLNGACETVYGHCKYFYACAAKDPAWGQSVLDNNFIKQTYDPTSFGQNK